MDIREWIDARDGIVHRDAAGEAGFSLRVLRAAVRSGHVRSIRRSWLATPSAPGDLFRAAESGGLVACVSAARRRGWWLPPGTDARLHLRVAPHARSTGRGFDGTVHWTKALAPAPRHTLIESIEDTLAHLAGCLTPERCRVVWESAMRTEKLSADALRLIAWPSRAAAECAQAVEGLSDSGLETILVIRLGPWGLPLRQQAVIAGHRVDLLIGERLVIQVDGFGFHSAPAQRGRDVAHDAELRLRGYTVLRFTYAQVIHEWPTVERTIARAIAMPAHLAA